MSLIEMRVPPVGESINEVTLSRWLKEEGAIVKLDEPICEFESDKATLEFPAEATGKLTYVAKEGDDLTIGALVATIDTSFVSEAATVPTAPKEIPMLQVTHLQLLQKYWKKRVFRQIPYKDQEKMVELLRLMPHRPFPLNNRTNLM
jgi:pyruvate/2-oxoglutarate dehydrogenase complex dihydrolipoamide acyltransferase (E2) component